VLNYQESKFFSGEMKLYQSKSLILLANGSNGVLVVTTH